MNGLGLEVVEVFKNDHFEIEHNVVHCAAWFVAMTFVSLRLDCKSCRCVKITRGQIALEI
jgi:hypothetical protein